MRAGRLLMDNLDANAHGTIHGIRVEGAASNVSLINSRVANAPQAGAVFMGASDVTVTNFTAVGTLGDGLHFNSNRRVTVNGLVAQNVGDGGLAFITY